MSMSFARASRLASSSPKDFDFQFFIYQNETEYSFWWGTQRVLQWFRALSDNTLWNCMICVSALAAIVLTVIELHEDLWIILTEEIINVLYFLHMIGSMYSDRYTFSDTPSGKMPWTVKLGYIVDLITYLHYIMIPLYYFHVVNKKIYMYVKIAVYYVRLHRPFRYLLSLNDRNLKGSVIGTTLKYLYMFVLMRICGAIIWMNFDDMQKRFRENEIGPTEGVGTKRIGNSTAENFYRAFYIVNKIFKPIGPAYAPDSDLWRIAFLVAMLSGCLLLSGIAITSLALIIGLYMRPEEVYRERFRLIMKDLKETHVPEEQINKVETFYRMYWHKQKGVSEAQLLPTFPPTMSSTVYTDVYFEAQQKSLVLCDLSYQFLSEIANVMTTINYIPGDAIIKRNAFKSSIYYISYGDVEMLTAEDDMTPILRFTRGSILSPCGVVTSCGSTRSHVQIRAATYCTAHVLKASDLWAVAMKHGKSSGQNFVLQSSFEEHFERVKRHYAARTKQIVKYKSNIVQFKHNIIALKEFSNEKGHLMLERNDIFLEISGCYIMRNRADASLNDESDAICLRPTFPCILQPRSSFQTVWSSCIAGIILLVTFTHPYYLVFLPTVSLSFRFYDYAMSVIYTLDILVHLSTGTNAEEGVPITFRQTSTQQLNSQWLVLDVLGTLPIFELVGDGRFAGMNKLLRLPKVFRVLKAMEAVAVYHSNALRFSSYFLLFIIATFLAATLNQAFMCWQCGYCYITKFIKTPYWELKPLTEEYVDDRILFGIFWAVSIMTLTGDKIGAFRMNDWYQSLFTLTMLELAGIMHIFISSVYSATIMVTTSMREEFDDCIYTVKDFLLRNNIDPSLSRRFVQYLQLCWYTDKAYSMTHKKQSILFDLPQHVYQDLLAMQRSKYILSVPIMKYLSKEALKGVSSHARLFYTSPNEILMNTGDIVNEIYIIKRGTCQVLDPETEAVVNLITVKDHFGVLECLLRFPAYYSVRAVTHVQIFSLSRKIFMEYLKLPQIKSTIEFAKKQKEFKSLQQRRDPFLWYEDPLPAPNRQFFKLPRKHEPDTAFQQPFQRLGFLSVLRYIFPRYTLRPDGKYLRRYEGFRGLAALLSSLIFPSYNIMRLQYPFLNKLVRVLDVTAYFDIIQRMLVGFYNEDGILVYHPAATAGNYLKGAFILDLVACLPLEFLDTGREPKYKGQPRQTATYQILMLNRLLQLYRLIGAMDIIGEGVERADILLVIKFIPVFMAMASLITCFMINWSMKITRPLNGYGYFIYPDSNETWVVLHADQFRFNITETPLNLLLATYFWVIFETTCVGYNVFNSVSLNCTTYLTIGIISGFMMVTYWSVRVIGIRSNINKPLATFQENIKDIMLFMKQEKLSKDLKVEVMRHYEYNWDKMGGTDYRSVLKLCDQITLRTDAILHIYGQTFSKCTILHDCDVSLLRLLGRGVKSVYYTKESYVISHDDVISDMYLIDHGVVDIETEGSIVGLQRGSLFGNLDAAKHVRFPRDAVASTNLHLLQMNSLSFNTIIQDFPSVKGLMKKHRPGNEVFIMGSTGDATDKQWIQKTTSVQLVAEPKRGKVHFVQRHEFIIMFYLIVVSLLCFYVDVYNAGFQDNRIPIIVFLYIMDMCFFFKILFNYTMPYLTSDPEDKECMYSRRKNYLKGEFRYDILSCLPIELLCLIRTDDRWLWWSLLRLNRLFRVVTVHRCLKRHKAKLNINLVLSTIVQVAIWFTVAIHVTTCLWYANGMVEDSFYDKVSWQYDKNGDSLCGNQYICSLYFIMTTFTQNGVGDIMPMTQIEVVFVTIFLILATMVFMIYVGEFSNIIQYQQFRCFTYYSSRMELQEFLRNNRVSANLVSMVDRYVLHLWRKTRGLQMPIFLVTAPPVLKQNIMSAAYMKHLEAHPVFKNCEPAFLRQVVVCMKTFIYSDEMHVVKENDITDSMYFVHSGRIQESAEDLEQVTGIFHAGNCFGTYNGLHRDTPFNNTYKTETSSQVLTLHLHDWEYLLSHFPKCKQVIYPDSDSKPDDDDEDGKRDKKKVLISEEDETQERLIVKGPLSEQIKETKLKEKPTVPVKAPAAADSVDEKTTIEEAKAPTDVSPFPMSWRQSIAPKSLEQARQQLATPHGGAALTKTRSEIFQKTKLEPQTPQQIWPNARATDTPEHSKKAETKPDDKKKKGTTLKEAGSDEDSEDDYLELTAEQLRRPSFVQKAMASAKKFLGKDIDQGAEAKDDLLIAQDEATTEALLKSIEQQTGSKHDLTSTATTSHKQDKQEKPNQNKKEDLTSRSYSFLGLKESQTERRSIDEILKKDTKQDKNEQDEKKSNEKPEKLNLLLRIGDSDDNVTKTKTNDEESMQTPEEIKPKTMEPELKTTDKVEKRKPVIFQSDTGDSAQQDDDEISESELEEPTAELDIVKLTDDIDEPVFPEDVDNEKQINNDEFQFGPDELDEPDDKDADINRRPKGVAIVGVDDDKIENYGEDVEKYLDKDQKTSDMDFEEDEVTHDEKILHRRPTAFVGKNIHVSDDEYDDEEDEKENMLAEKIQTPDKTVEESPWPLNNRRRSTVENVDREAVEAELKNIVEEVEESDDEPPPVLAMTRRRSTVENVDRKAVEEELKALSSARSSEVTESPWPLNSKKSTENFNKEAVEQELKQLAKLEEIKSMTVVNKENEPEDEEEEEEEEPDDDYKKYALQRRSTIQKIVGTAKKAFADKEKPDDDNLLREQDEATTEALLKSYAVDIQGTAAKETVDEQVPIWKGPPQSKGQKLQEESVASISTDPQPRPEPLESTVTIASVASEGSVYDLTKKEDEKTRMARRATRVRYVEEPRVTAIDIPEIDDLNTDPTSAKKPPQKGPKDVNESS